MHKKIENLSLKIEEVSSFFTIFNKSKLKGDIFTSLDSLHNEFKTKVSDYEDMQTSFDNHKKESIKNIDNLKEKSGLLKNKLNDTLCDFTKYKYTSIQEISVLNIKHLLVSELLSAKPESEGLFKYKELLYNDFMDFANNEGSLSNEAEAILLLQSIERELELISSYSDLFTKNTVAVGGGFSAGKSEFISSFFSNDTKLPIGIEPTTAIPTYVMNHSETNNLIGCSRSGGAVDLSKIDKSFQSKLSHSFMKSFDFNLKEIMPFMVLGTPMSYKNICFIDTPGYNPSDASDSYTGDDIATAKEFLTNANTFIWLIGADANGTIPASDLTFLNDLELENKKVYVILNKADLKAKSDLEDILDEIEESLDDYDIQVVGLSAYSSINKEEYCFRKLPIQEFIDSCDIEAQVHKDLVQKLYEVFTMYKHALLLKIKEKKTVKSQLKSISLDLAEDGYDDTSSDAFQRLDNLNSFFDSKKQEENLLKLEIVMKNLKASIDMIFSKELNLDMKEILDDELDINFDFNIEQEIESLYEEEISDQEEFVAEIVEEEYDKIDARTSTILRTSSHLGLFGLFK